MINTHFSKKLQKSTQHLSWEENYPLKPMQPILPKILLFYMDFRDFGGIPRYLLDISRALQERGRYEPVLVCTTGTKLYRMAIEQNIKTYGIPLPGWVQGEKLCWVFFNPLLRLLDLQMYWHLYRLLRQIRPALIHVNRGFVENLFFKCLGYPLVFVFHGYNFDFSYAETQPGVKRWAVKLRGLLFKLLAPFVDQLIFVSASEQRQLCRLTQLPKPWQGQVLYNGVPVAHIRKIVERTNRRDKKIALGLPVGVPVVSYFHPLRKVKNPLLFVEFAEKLCEMEGLSDCHFLIGGDGPLMSKMLERVANSKISGQIHVIGHRNDIFECMAISDLALFLPSLESFGLSLLEAMACGILCLAFETGGMREILDIPEKKYFISPLYDLNILVQKAAFLLRLPLSERRELSKCLLLRAREFDMSVFINNMEMVYDRALSGKNPR